MAWFVLAALWIQDGEVDQLIKELGSSRKGARDAAAAKLTANAPRWWKEYEARAADAKDAKLRELLIKLAAEGKRRDPERVMAVLDEILEERRWERTLPLPGYFEDNLRTELSKRDLDPTADAFSRAMLASAERLATETESPRLVSSLANSVGATATPETRADARKALVRLLGFKDPIVSSSAVDSLAAMGATEEAEALAGAALDGPGVTRMRAIQALGALKVGAAALEKLLVDPDPLLRGAALTALTLVDFEAACRAAPRLIGDEAAEVRRDAIRIAQRRRDEACTEAVLKAIEDPEAIVRADVARYLGKLRDPAHDDSAAKLLQDPNARVRRNAAAALGMMGAKDQSDALAKMLADPDPVVIEAAIRSLALLGASEHADAIARLFRNNAVRYMAYQAIGQLRAEKHAPALLQAVKSLDDDVTNRALIALGKMRAKSSVDGLVEVLKNTQRGRPCANAIIALARLRHSESAAAVFEAGSKAQSSQIPIALDAYHVLALDARDTKRIEAAFRDPAAGRALSIQAVLAMWADPKFERALERLFDPDASTVGELIGEMRRQLGLDVRFELPEAGLAEPLELHAPSTLREAFSYLGEVFGYRIGLIWERGALRLTTVDRGREFWLDWLLRRY